ncbi:40S ribosomal protein S6, partial [Durusdinium trenchii]
AGSRFHFFDPDSMPGMGGPIMPMFALALLGCLGISLGSTCLPDAIPEDQRQNISMNGISMPLGLTVGASSAISEMYAILASEILGYNVVQYPSPSTMANLHYLSGCDGVVPVEECTWPALRHVGFELWESSWADPDWLAKKEQLGQRSMQMEGSIGFSGKEGLYVMGPARQKSREHSGLHLAYYGNLNASWFHPENYAANVSQVDINKLSTCKEHSLAGAQLYGQVTGDADGLETVDGVISYKCWQDKWWLAPACRSNPGSCMAVVTAQGWAFRELTQQAFFHNIPMAIANGLDFATYVELNAQLQSFLFWWNPDTAFVLYDTTLVEMPPWNPSEQKQGILRSATVVIKLQGAVSESYCHCDSGSFLWEGHCEVCMEGASCLGANRLELLPGFFSREEAPGDVYNCFDERLCPGGPPGTCAAGRDTSSVACTDCKEGFREGNDKVCEACGDGDYAFFGVVVALVFGAVALLYALLLNEAKSKQRSSTLVVAAGFQQFLTIVQMLSVLRRFEIDWREPFASVLVFLEVLSFDVEMLSAHRRTWDLRHGTVSCVTQLSPVGLFTFRALMIPMLMCVALVVHLCYILYTGCKSFKTSNLLRTIGTMFLIFFIVLFSMLVAPYQCNAHPNGKLTLKRYKNVFCDREGDHLAMLVIGGFACSMPVVFLALCTWTVVLELPRRIARSDARFLDACGFLIKRFRPGMEIASVFFLIRNALVVLCPLLHSTSGQLLMMCIILIFNSIMVAFFKPWRFLICNCLDNVLLAGMLVILILGAISVKDSDPGATMVVVMLFLMLMCLSILGTIGHGIFKHFQQKYRKQFRYFLCHQKNAAGSMARLLKMELEQRLPGTKTFIDCDDLNDLTRLFSYVGQDTQTFLVLCSPDILTRKWCVGEMVTARANGVDSLLLTWPSFVRPDEKFIAKYPTIVPDINELTKYGISLQDVEEALRWLAIVPGQALPEQISPTTTHLMVTGLVTAGTKAPSTKLSARAQSFTSEYGTNFPVLVDPMNSEAVAAAMVLSSLLKPKLLGTNLPLPSIQLSGLEVAQEATLSLLICSHGCFKSEQLQTWLLQASRLPKCCMIPVITEDAFEMPSPAFFAELQTTSKLTDDEFFAKCGVKDLVIKALFQEIAVVFVPQNYASTHEDLRLRANQAV